MVELNAIWNAFDCEGCGLVNVFTYASAFVSIHFVGTDTQAEILTIF